MGIAFPTRSFVRVWWMLLLPLLATSSAHASCGDYVHVRANGFNSPSRQVLPEVPTWPIPCDGPLCQSREPEPRPMAVPQFSPPLPDLYASLPREEEPIEAGTRPWGSDDGGGDAAGFPFLLERPPRPEALIRQDGNFVNQHVAAAGGCS